MSDLSDVTKSHRKDVLEQYAPVVYHSSDETNFPTSVDWLLSRTALWAYDDSTTPDTHVKLVASPSQVDLIRQSWVSPSSPVALRSDGTRSRRKQCTFYLEDVREEHRFGSRDSKDWITYCHFYANTRGGITLQYWRCYAYNNAANDHGGDWEGIHVVLDPREQPIEVVLLGHRTLKRLPFSQLQAVGSHPIIFSEGGGHATRRSPRGIQARRNGQLCELDPGDARTFVRQETWEGGSVSWFDGSQGRSGGLLDVGSKLSPANGQLFVKYSGLWGSPGVLYETSGYWGPAYNETQMSESGFVAAWADGMLNADAQECHPTAWSR